MSRLEIFLQVLAVDAQKLKNVAMHVHIVVEKYALQQRSGTYGSRARCSSFNDGIWLAWYFLNTIVTDKTFSVKFLQSHQRHHAAPEDALTVRSMLRENSDIYHCLKLLILLKNAHVI